MKVKIVGIPVRDQEKALKFYTEKLGFVKKHDISLDEGNRWLTVAAKEEKDGAEILLEPSPNHFKPAKTYQKALFDADIPYTQFRVESIDDEYERLTKLGVEISKKPSEMNSTKIAIFNDTCGNRIQLVEML